ncbi:fatty acid beta-hydroxylating cytochrome P450 [Gracilibacillus halophilus YIM-C55.5]|uniref:Fatty acid beta-hydroxylating cytochrome P450 n=1 Tax=Gracilibacillus halophilus YIM-C55.5 TaxID=1308866 RepID=N4WPB4_9BACI|nr:cytochrome P450 [Gracilibacillus halophilus]ENH96325.1 fatty acid beta-hydroxylating cytochrome P450 [Gracilibacillus halophilus YIM-C55.5]
MNQVPTEKTLDHSLTLMNEGYLYIKNRVDRFGSNVFHTRLLGQKVICMSGEDAAKIFYDSERFQRKGAAPKRVQKTLFGEHAIQTIDGQIHIHRKKLFLSLMTSTQQNRIAQMVYSKWHEKVGSSRPSMILFEEARNILCEVACEWTGIPVKKHEIPHLAKDFTDMVYAFGAVGKRYRRGKKARKKTEKWMKSMIEQVRNGEIKAKNESALQVMAFHRQLNGKRLSSHMAAVELINVIRPIVAISTFITFSAVALHEYPAMKTKLEVADSTYYDCFVHEVRRFYPFAPFLGARVKQSFVWNNCFFKKGRLVLLDIYGTNHDPQLWDEPHRFQPERFRNWRSSMFDLIPQGGGHIDNDHRCPGERMTITVMKASLDFLVNQIEFQVPSSQDFRYILSTVPTLPKSGFMMKEIKKVN